MPGVAGTNAFAQKPLNKSQRGQGFLGMGIWDTQSSKNPDIAKISHPNPDRF